MVGLILISVDKSVANMNLTGLASTLFCTMHLKFLANSACPQTRHLCWLLVSSALSCGLLPCQLSYGLTRSDASRFWLVARWAWLLVISSLPSLLLRISMIGLRTTLRVGRLSSWFGFSSCSSDIHGDPAPGLSSVKSGLSPSVHTVSQLVLPAIG